MPLKARGVNLYVSKEFADVMNKRFLECNTAKNLDFAGFTKIMAFGSDMNRPIQLTAKKKGRGRTSRTLDFELNFAHF